MRPRARIVTRLLAVVALAAVVVLALVRDRRPPAPARDGARFAGAGLVFEVDEERGQLRLLRDGDAAPPVALDLSLLVDGVERPLIVGKGGLVATSARSSRATLPIAVGDDRLTATVEVRVDDRGEALFVVASVPPAVAPHTYALRASFSEVGRSVFVPGAGGVVARGATETNVAVLEDAASTVALIAPAGGSASGDPPETEADDAGSRVHLTARARAPEPAGAGTTIELSVLASSPQALWGRAADALGRRHARVHGVVHGARTRPHVVGLDAEGHPRLRTLANEDGGFDVEAEPNVVLWVAAEATTTTSVPAHFVPGTAWELSLDVSPGGEIHARIVDDDTHRPILARLVVHGIEGTLDPTFGPDYRASGAGPLMDVASGEVTTPVPAGRYRVSATKGLEWSIDAAEVKVESGGRAEVDLRLRRVVPTPRMVGCDLHVHARPSFDSPVTPEDRVLSLVSAGVEFAVPSEHNMVGDYGPALGVLGLAKELAFAPGIEVTTDMPRFGHFGVFPYPLDRPPPRSRGTNATRLLASARRDDPGRVVQINHPRMEGGIGYFAVRGYDAGAGRIPAGIRTDFDTIEVYNGYDLERRARVEETMNDWFSLLDLDKHIAATGSSDSHRVQYQWAGYPRTYAFVEAPAAGEGGGAVDARAVVAAVAHARSFVTSGPIVELTLESDGARAGPGETLARAGGHLRGDLRIHAAPWIDVTDVEILAGGPAAGGPGGAPLRARLLHRTLPSAAPRVGREPGTLEEASARTVRLAETLALDLPEGTHWIVAVVRGERRLDDVLPFMPFQPLAFTNPIFVTP